MAGGKEMKLIRPKIIFAFVKIVEKNLESGRSSDITPINDATSCEIKEAIDELRRKKGKLGPIECEIIKSLVSKLKVEISEEEINKYLNGEKK
jgi:hypothetical protein